MADNALLELQGQLITGSTFEEVVAEDGVYLKAPESPGLGIALEPAIAQHARVS